jgi:hypothetical protein
LPLCAFTSSTASGLARVSASQVTKLNEKRLTKILKKLKRKAITIVIDETGDRKKGKKTDYVARQYLGSVGKVDNGISRYSLSSSHMRYDWAKASVGIGLRGHRAYLTTLENRYRRKETSLCNRM